MQPVQDRFSSTVARWRAASPTARATTSAAARSRRADPDQYVERVLAEIDADYVGDRTIVLAGHDVLLLFAAPRQLALLARSEHGRTIPLTDSGLAEIPQTDAAEYRGPLAQPP